MKAEQRIYRKPPNAAPRLHIYSMVAPYDGRHKKFMEKARHYIRMLLLSKHEHPISKCNERRIHWEKRSLKALRQSMLDREVGGFVLKQAMEPGDYLIVDDALTIFTKEDDLITVLNRLQERGQHLHILDFHGAAVDCDSPAGEMLIGNFKLIHGFNRSYRKRMFAIARARAGRVQIRTRAGVPFWCEQVSINGETVLILKSWAVAAAELIGTTLHGPSKFRKPPVISARINRAGLGEGWKKTYKNCLDLYWFHKGWVEAGRPDVNTLKFPEFTHEYRAKQVVSEDLEHLQGLKPGPGYGKGKKKTHEDDQIPGGGDELQLPDAG